MKNLKKCINMILNITIVFLSILLFLSIFLDIQTSFMKKDYRSFFGISAFEIKTGSMTGTINAGDLVLVKNTKNVELNDIVTYRIGNEFVTHRIIQQLDNTYVTKGDANNTDDVPISSKQILGKVIVVLPKLGFIKSVFFKAEILIPFIIVLFIICLIIDDKENQSKSYFSFFKSRIKHKKNVNLVNNAELDNNIDVNDNIDMSKTAVLSKVNINSNYKLYKTIKEEKMGNENNKVNNSSDINSEDDDYDVPRIIKIL